MEPFPKLRAIHIILAIARGRLLPKQLAKDTPSTNHKPKPNFIISWKCLFCMFWIKEWLSLQVFFNQKEGSNWSPINLEGQSEGLCGETFWPQDQEVSCVFSALAKSRLSRKLWAISMVSFKLRNVVNVHRSHAKIVVLVGGKARNWTRHLGGKYKRKASKSD